MADESIIVEQPKMEYNTVDIIENDDNAQVESETLDIIDVEDVKVFTVETDEAFASLGEQNEDLKHQRFTGRDFPDQHPIIAITGLRAELDSIEALQTIYSNEKQTADYYEWSDGNVLLENRIGYFVSICKDIRTIKICNGEDIFGVTVDNAAFIGGQDDVDRDDTYGLVAHTGIVSVRCESNVKVGDYVISNNYGVAEKTDNNYGCKVIALHNNKGVLHAVILLNMSVDQMDKIGRELADFNERMNTAETNIVTAINVANKAYDLAEGSVKTSENASQKADDAVNKANDAMSIVDASEKQIQEAIKASAEAKVIADAAVVSAEAIRLEAVETANQTLTDTTNKINEIKDEIREFENSLALDVDKVEESIDTIYKDIDVMRNDIVELEENTNSYVEEVRNTVDNLYNNIDITNNELNNLKGDVDFNIAGVKKDINDVLKQVSDVTEEITPLTEWTDGKSSGIAGFVAKSDNYTTQLETVVQWKDEMTDEDTGTIAMINQKVTKNESNINSLAVWKSSVAEDVNSIANIKQTANKNEASIEELTSLQSKTSESIAGITQKVTDNEATITDLTTWKGQVANDNGTLRIAETITQINQVASENQANIDALTIWKGQVANEDGKLKLAETVAQVSQKANDNESNISSITQWKDKTTISLADVEQKASDNEASIKNLVTWKDTTDTAISSIQQTANANKSSIESLTSWKTETNEAIADVQQQASDNEAVINNLTTWKGSVANDDGTLKIAETVTRITQQSDSDHAQLGLLAAWKEDIGDEVGSLAELQAQADENSAKISALVEWQGAVEGLEDSVASLAGIQTTVDGHTAQINSLTELQTGTSKALTDFKQEVSKDYATIASVAKLETDISDSIASVRQDVAENYATIASVTKLKTETDGKITDAVSDVKQEVSDTYATIQSVNNFKTELSDSITGVREEAAETYATIESVTKLETDTNTSLTDFKQLASDTYATMESVTSMESDLNKSIAGVEQKADANGASIQSFVSNVNKYSVGEYSQSYGLTMEQAKTILEKGMIYVPTVDHKEKYSKTTYNFTPGYYYTWSGTTWNSSASPLVNFSDSYVIGNDIAPYWYIPGDKNVIYNGITYESNTLYQWRNGQWVAIATLAGNVDNRKTTLIKQTVDSISATVSNVKSDVAGLTARVGATESSVETLATWKSDVEDDVSNIASIKSTADDVGASIAQVVSEFSGKEVVVLDTAWSSSGKDTSKVYYVKSTQMYYYRKSNAWKSTPDPNVAGLKINAAYIVTAINESGSSIVLNADKINLNGAVTANHSFTIDESGYMTAIGGQIAGWTIKQNQLVNITRDANNNVTSVFGMQVPHGSTQVALTIGGTNTSAWGSNAPFYVTHTGELHSKSGKIGGWNIESTYIDSYANTRDSGARFYLASNASSADNYLFARDSSNVVKFKVSKAGILTASGVNISGTITATDGSIGGWNIDSHQIAKTQSVTIDGTTKTVTNAFQQPGSGKWALAIGSPSSSSYGSSPFRVDHHGNLYAASATISGKITSKEGSKIATWTICDNAIHSDGKWGTDAVFMCTGTDGKYSIGGSSSRAGWVFVAGSKFGVTKTGDLYANSVTLTGKITATSGTLKDGVKFGSNGYTTIADYDYGGGHGGTRWKIGSSNGITLTSTTGGDTIYLTSVYGYLKGTWKLNSSSISTSDRNAKNSINVMSNQYETLFDYLQPVTYKYNAGTSNRIHTGFIAQDVLNAVNIAGLDTKDFAAVCCDTIDNKGKSEWGLRYEEFISLNTWQIQKAKARISELEARVKKLEKMIKGE